MNSITKPFSYRDDPSVPKFPDDRPIIIYDGNCRLCSRGVRFVLRHDRHDRFRFIAAQSPLGAALYRHYGLDPVNYETNIMLDEGSSWFRSECSIRMFQGLGFPWSLLVIARLLPLWLRDCVYNTLARNRLRWFGVRKACFLRDPDQAGKFLG